MRGTRSGKLQKEKKKLGISKSEAKLCCQNGAAGVSTEMYAQPSAEYCALLGQVENLTEVSRELNNLCNFSSIGTSSDHVEEEKRGFRFRHYLVDEGVPIEFFEKEKRTPSRTQPATIEKSIRRKAAVDSPAAAKKLRAPTPPVKSAKRTPSPATKKAVKKRVVRTPSPAPQQVKKAHRTEAKAPTTETPIVGDFSKLRASSGGMNGKAVACRVVSYNPEAWRKRTGQPKVEGGLAVLMDMHGATMKMEVYRCFDDRDPEELNVLSDELLKSIGKVVVLYNVGIRPSDNEDPSPIITVKKKFAEASGGTVLEVKDPASPTVHHWAPVLVESEYHDDLPEYVHSLTVVVQGHEPAPGGVSGWKYFISTYWGDTALMVWRPAADEGLDGLKDGCTYVVTNVSWSKYQNWTATVYTTVEEVEEPFDDDGDNGEVTF